MSCTSAGRTYMSGLLSLLRSARRVLGSRSGVARDLAARRRLGHDVAPGRVRAGSAVVVLAACRRVLLLHLGDGLTVGLGPLGRLGVGLPGLLLLVGGVSLLDDPAVLQQGI